MRIRLVIILSGSVALFGLDKQPHIWAFNKEKHPAYGGVLGATGGTRISSPNGDPQQPDSKSGARTVHPVYRGSIVSTGFQMGWKRCPLRLFRP